MTQIARPVVPGIHLIVIRKFNGFGFVYTIHSPYSRSITSTSDLFVIDTSLFWDVIGPLRRQQDGVVFKRTRSSFDDVRE